MQTTIGEGSGWTSIAVAAGSPETVFNIPYPFFGLDDVSVDLEQDAVRTRLVRGNDYDVVATANEDGIFPAGQVVLRYEVQDCTITLTRLTAIERTSNFPLSGFLDRNSLNQQLNRIAAIEQEFRRDSSLAIRLSPQDLPSGWKMVLPPLAFAPGMALMFDADGRAYFGTQVDLTGVPASGFGLELILAADAATALSLLGMSPYFQTLIGAPDAAALRGLLGIVDPGAIAPIGTIHEYAGTDEPANFMWCDGRAISRTTYSACFAKLGIHHGAGDGTTTFNIPDRRGRVGAGKDDMGGTAAGRLTSGKSGVDGTALGAHGGAQSKILAIGEMPTHSHPLAPATRPGGNSGIGGGGGGNSLWDNGGANVAVGSTGGGAEFGTMNPVYVNNFIIKVL